MNNFSNCKRCKKIFQFSATRAKEVKEYCPKCVNEILEEIDELLEIIIINPSISVKELSDTSNISETSIKKYISIGKLPVIEGYEGNSRCKKCLAHIKTSGYCDNCKKTLGVV